MADAASLNIPTALQEPGRRLHDERSGLYLMSDRYVADEVIRECPALTGSAILRTFAAC